MDKYKETFRQEANELLQELEKYLLELEEAPDDRERIGQVFRALHTLKGSGAMFGFNRISNFTHEVENVFSSIRDGKLGVTKELINVALDVKDHIKSMLEAEDESGTETDRRSRELLESMLCFNLNPVPKTPEALPKKTKPDTPIDQKKIKTYHIHFQPFPEIFTTGANPVLLLKELCETGECEITVHTEKVPGVETISPELSYLYWDIIIKTPEDINTLKDVFIFVEDNARIDIEAIDEKALLEDEDVFKKIQTTLSETGSLSGSDVHRAIIDKTREDVPREEPAGDRPAVSSSAGSPAKTEKKTLQSSVRVAAEKLDSLVDLVGELVTIQAHLTRKAGISSDSELLSISEEVERITSELRENAMSIRMLPIGTTFTRFRRLVRDLSAAMGKEIVMTTDGGDTELDKTVIEQLNDPLVHVIRNIIDHGIELPQERLKKGKPRHGTIHLSAVHSGPNVLIKISGDGKGFDLEAIRKKGMENQLITEDAVLSEKDLLKLVFSPGFSTAAEITGVSGRGVGMDVVKRTVEGLGGAIEIENRKPYGSMTSLVLPLTLAIVDGLLVQVSGVHYVLPLSAVEECFELTRKNADRAKNRHIVDFRGKIIPFICLREFFNLNGSRLNFQKIIVTETKKEKIALGVDLIVGKHQTVIKSLGKMYKNAEGVSGATILGDGTVALILDVGRISDIINV